MRKTCIYAFLLIIMIGLAGCGGSKEDQVKTLPLLRYDYGQNTLHPAEWDLEQGNIINKQDILLKQQDSSLVNEIKWNGNEKIILPKNYENTPFTDIDMGYFQSVVEKNYENQVYNHNWCCWKDANGRYMLSDQKNTYQLDLDDAYGIGGLIASKNKVILLLCNMVNGETVLYHYDIAQEIGTTEQISGFHTLMNSQLSPEKAVFVQEDQFYLTNMFDIYVIDTEKNVAQLVFSKNQLVDSLKESNAKFAEQAASCRIAQFGVYQDGLAVSLMDPEGMASSWLYYQKDNIGYIIELLDENSYYLLPNIV